MAAVGVGGVGVKVKRARNGVRVGKEVLVSDGMYLVLEGVVSAVEDGQARVHYKGGRKKKMDEWIDVASERFLSQAQADQQQRLAAVALRANIKSEPVSEAEPMGKKKRARGKVGYTTSRVDFGMGQGWALGLSQRKVPEQGEGGMRKPPVEKEVLGFKGGKDAKECIDSALLKVCPPLVKVDFTKESGVATAGLTVTPDAKRRDWKSSFWG
ncbi:unnamed protein product, partial [Choristocarpus tenellus]